MKLPGIVSLLLLASPAGAASICPLRAPQGEVALMRSRDAVDACQAEVQATGDASTICARGIVALVPNSTKAQYLGSAGFASGLVRVRVLEGKDAGVEGVVRTEFCKLE